MSKSYLLPCSCGKSITIDIGQAGQSILCDACGKKVEVPTMRAIRELKSAQEPAEEDEKKRPVESGSAQSVLFSIGLLVAVVGLAVAAVVSYKRSQLVALATPPVPVDNKHEDEFIDTRNVEEIFDWWLELEQQPLTWEKPIFVLAREKLPIWTMMLTAAFVVAMVGIGMVAFSIVKKPSTAPRT